MSHISLDLTLSVDQKTGQKMPTIYKGETGTLSLGLKHSSSSDVNVPKDAVLKIYFPSWIESAVPAMTIQFSGWTFTKKQKHLELKADAAHTWKTGQTLTIKISGVKCDDQPQTGVLRVSAVDFGARFRQGRAQITLAKPVMAGNAKLNSVLKPTLDDDGKIYISTVNDPLQNSLSLNLKNTGSKPLFDGTNRTGQPKVIVSFTYGDTAGALCPADDKGSPAVGSAWNISEKVNIIGEGNDWKVTLISSLSGDMEAPQWVLEPESTNLGLIGTGANENVTFRFDGIVSLLPEGHTQMVVLFTGFKQSETKDYDDWVQVMDIDKVDAPANRGVIGFSGTQPAITINSWKDKVTAEFTWTVFGTQKVELKNDTTEIKTITRSYSGKSLLHLDRASVDLTGFLKSETIMFTLYAYDGAGKSLSASNQFQIRLHFPPVDVKFDLGPADNLNPLITITLMPKSFVDTGHGNVVLKFKGIAKFMDNYSTVQDSLIYTAPFHDLFGHYLDVGDNDLTLTFKHVNRQDVTVKKNILRTVPDIALKIAIDLGMFGGEKIWNPYIKVEFTPEYDLIERATFKVANITKDIPFNGKKYAINGDFKSIFGTYLQSGENNFVLMIYRKNGLPAMKKEIKTIVDKAKRRVGTYYSPAKNVPPSLG